MKKTSNKLGLSCAKLPTSLSSDQLNLAKSLTSFKQLATDELAVVYAQLYLVS